MFVHGQLGGPPYGRPRIFLLPNMDNCVRDCADNCTDDLTYISITKHGRFCGQFYGRHRILVLQTADDLTNLYYEQRDDSKPPKQPNVHH